MRKYKNPFRVQLWTSVFASTKDEEAAVVTELSLYAKRCKQMMETSQLTVVEMSSLL